MKKYNLKSIMKNAWNLFRSYNANLGCNREGKKIIRFSFSMCLKKAWDEAKSAARVFTGLVRDVKMAGTLMRPILVNVDMDALTVTGNTYPVRQMMRDLGLSWDKAAKAWTGSREALNALCARYVA